MVSIWIRSSWQSHEGTNWIGQYRKKATTIVDVEKGSLFIPTWIAWTKAKPNLLKVDVSKRCLLACASELNSNISCFLCILSRNIPHLHFIARHEFIEFQMPTESMETTNARLKFLNRLSQLDLYLLLLFYSITPIDKVGWCVCVCVCVFSSRNQHSTDWFYVINVVRNLSPDTILGDYCSLCGLCVLTILSNPGSLLNSFFGRFSKK